CLDHSRTALTFFLFSFSLVTVSYFFFLSPSRLHRDLHSFPTRRSSDLTPTIIKPTDAIIRMSATCVCGSDLWPYRGINPVPEPTDRKSTRLNSSHQIISYAVFCLKKKNIRESYTKSTHTDITHSEANTH